MHPKHALRYSGMCPLKLVHTCKYCRIFKALVQTDFGIKQPQSIFVTYVRDSKHSFFSDVVCQIDSKSSGCIWCYVIYCFNTLENTNSFPIIFLPLSIFPQVPIIMHNESEQAKSWSQIFSEETIKQCIPVVTAWQLNERM